MKSLNTVRPFKISYPRNTPRVSRKRDWMDRSEWRKSPDTNYGVGTQMIDDQMTHARNTPDLSGTPYKQLPDIAVRAGRIGLLKG
jgi:hypothetical protein